MNKLNWTESNWTEQQPQIRPNYKLQPEKNHVNSNAAVQHELNKIRRNSSAQKTRTPVLYCKTGMWLTRKAAKNWQI